MCRCSWTARGTRSSLGRGRRRCGRDRPSRRQPAAGSVLTPLLGIGDPRSTSASTSSAGCAAPASSSALVQSGRAAVAFSMYPGERGRPDDDCRRRRHHAAEVHVVRAQAARRPAVARDLSVRLKCLRRRRRLGPPVYATTCPHAFSISPPVPPSCRCPCSSRRSASWSRCRASACRSWRSAIARRPSRICSNGAIADIRELADVPANYRLLMLQGGASLQFSMVPMNLLAAGCDGRLHRHRDVGRQGDQGSQAGRTGERHGLDEGRQLQSHSRARPS